LTHALTRKLTALHSAAAGGLRLRGGMDNCLPVAGAIFDKEKRAKIKVAEVLKTLYYSAFILSMQN
jgi:hypothetical protein